MWNHFDFLAPWYDRLISPPEPDRLMALAGLPADGRLLDAGGGTGRVAAALRGAIRQLVVADPSGRMLQQAHAKDGLLAVRCPSECLPFPGAGFERVIMVDAWHHVRHQDATAKELWRVLKPGGLLVIEEPDIQHGVVKLVALVEKITLMRSRFLPPDHIAAIFARMGARTRVVREGYNAWVVAEKAP